LTPCQRELKFDVLPVTPPRYVTRLYVCRKNLWQVYQTDNNILWVWYGMVWYTRVYRPTRQSISHFGDTFALPNTTRDSDHCWLRIYEWLNPL